MKPATEMLEDGIRKRAYYLWEASGRPQGRDHEFWSRACEQIAIEGNRSAGQLSDAAVGTAKPAHSKPVKKSASVPAEVTDQGGRKPTPQRRRRKT